MSGRRAVALAIAAVLIADGIAVGAVGHGSAPAAGSLAAAVPQLEAFVAADRGLAYLRPVTVEVLSPRALQTFVASQTADETQLEDAEDQAYQALGLISSWQAYAQHEQVFESQDVAGLYEDGTNTIRIAAVASDYYTRSVLAHELTHALDDQHQPLLQTFQTGLSSAAGIGGGAGALDGLPLPDIVTGIRGLIEGDAEHTRDDYLATLSPAQLRLERQQELAAGAGIRIDQDDRTLAPLTYLPYVEGVAFVRAVLAAGGRSALDQAFRTPPTTSAQILHPGGFIRGQDVDEDVSTPAEPNGTFAASGSMGEAGLAVVLYGGGSDQVRDGLAAGWRGDVFSTATSGNRVCINWNVAIDTAADATAISALLRGRLPRATVSASPDGATTLLSLNSCR